MAKLKFHSEDNGNCRVYYKQGRNLYCYQNDGSFGLDHWRFYVCSKDGEPSYEIITPYIVPQSQTETAIGRELNEHMRGG